MATGVLKIGRIRNSDGFYHRMAKTGADGGHPLRCLMTVELVDIGFECLFDRVERGVIRINRKRYCFGSILFNDLNLIPEDN